MHLDGCVEIDAAYYSAPPGWIGRRVSVQWNDLHIRLLNPTTGQLLREHVRAPRGWHRIDDADRPSRTPTKTLAVLSAAHHAGASIGAVCDHIHQHEGAGGIRCTGGKTVCLSAGISSRAFAVPNARSTLATSISTRR